MDLLMQFCCIDFVVHCDMDNLKLMQEKKNSNIINDN